MLRTMNGARIVLGLQRVELAMVFNVSPRTTDRWRLCQNRPAQRYRALGDLLWGLIIKIERYFGKEPHGRRRARAWLRTPHPQLDDRTPLTALLDGDAVAVWRAVPRLAVPHGAPTGPGDEDSGLGPEPHPAGPEIP